MARFSLAFLAGDLALLLLPAPPALVVSAALLAMGAGLLVCPRSSLRLVAAGVCAGTLCGWAAADEQLRSHWPESRAGERVLAEAIIEGIPVAGPQGWSFDASMRVSAPAPGRVLRARIQWRDPLARPRAGERWVLLVSLQQPRAWVNPGAADGELRYFRERVHAIATVVDSRLNRRLDAGHRPLAALREQIVNRIERRIADRDAGALVSALAVGASGEMSREQWRVFNATGTTHLVAISGLHVTLFALVALAVAGYAWRAALWRFVRVPREVFTACAAIVASAAYALLAGFSVPTQRTLAMLTAWLIARSAARAWGPGTSLGIALLAVLALDAFAPLASGFWLSFGAICAIVLVTHGRARSGGRLREALRVQAAVSLAIAPFTLAWFGGVSLAGLLANMVAIPLISGLFVPLVLLAVLTMPAGETLSGTLLDVTAWLYRAGWPWLAAMADSPLAVVYASPPLWWHAIAIPCAGLSLIPWPARMRLACVVWLLPLAFAGVGAPRPGDLELTVLDVGQGTAIVVRTARHVLVYDAGDVYGGAGGAVERALLPFLRSRNIYAVDRVVLSRLASQGSAGLTALLASVPIGQVLLGGFATADFPQARPCAAGRVWHWDGVRFQVFEPRDRRGAGSCVLQITAPGGRVLLPGHVDGEAERQLVRAGVGASDIVIVPRHGSDTASSHEFIEAVGARWAFLPGRRTGVRGEKPAVQRWEAHGTRVLATGDSGAICVSIDRFEGVREPRAERRVRRPLWRASS